jgi:hypothetical protein
MEFSLLFIMLVDGETSYCKKLNIIIFIIINTAVGIRHADHVAPSIRKSWH